MSYTQFGYSSYAASSPLVIGSSSGQNACYERTGVSPESQYDARLYPRLPSYTTSYQADPNLDPTTTFYAPALNSSYGMKESPDPWRGISSSASYYYDPTLAAYGYGGLDFNGARRKNVTRDSTSTLKAWLNEHRKNPYPTKGEKIMLAIITKMTLTQVSTWFANARRRLKKENKMTWEPRNKAESHDDDSGKERDTDKEPDAEPPAAGFRDEGCGEKADPLRGMQGSASTMADGADMELSAHHHRSDPFCPSVGGAPQQHFEDSSHPELMSSTTNSGYTPSVSSQSSSPDIDAYHMAPHHHRPGKESGTAVVNSSCFGEPHHHLYKPKIWSLADTATNKAVETALMPYVHQDLCSPTTGTWLAGGGTSKGYENCSSSSLSFQRFGGYNCSLHSFNPISLQTDTPPQTPPNMKVGGSAAAAHQAAAPVPSSAYMEGGAYTMGHTSALCPTTDGMPDVQMQDDKMDDYSNSHSSGLPQTSTSNQNLNTDCITEDYDDPSQYSGQAVR